MSDKKYECFRCGKSDFTESDLGQALIVQPNHAGDPPCTACYPTLPCMVRIIEQRDKFKVERDEFKEARDWVKYKLDALLAIAAGPPTESLTEQLAKMSDQERVSIMGERFNSIFKSITMVQPEVIVNEVDIKELELKNLIRECKKRYDALSDEEHAEGRLEAVQEHFESIRKSHHWVMTERGLGVVVSWQPDPKEGYILSVAPTVKAGELTVPYEVGMFQVLPLRMEGEFMQGDRMTLVAHTDEGPDHFADFDLMKFWEDRTPCWGVRHTGVLSKPGCRACQGIARATKSIDLDSLKTENIKNMIPVEYKRITGEFKGNAPKTELSQINKDLDEITEAVGVHKFYAFLEGLKYSNNWARAVDGSVGQVEGNKHFVGPTCSVRFSDRTENVPTFMLTALRKKNEFKKGDVVRAVDHKFIVTDIDLDEGILVGAERHHRYNLYTCELMEPVEFSAPRPEGYDGASGVDPEC